MIRSNPITYSRQHLYSHVTADMPSYEWSKRLRVPLHDDHILGSWVSGYPRSLSEAALRVVLQCCFYSTFNILLPVLLFCVESLCYDGAPDTLDDTPLLCFLHLLVASLLSVFDASCFSQHGGVLELCCSACWLSLLGSAICR